MNGIGYLHAGKPRKDLAGNNRGFVIGVDGGGTKTLAAAVSLDGKVLSVAKGGNVNYQGAGRVAAEAELKRVIKQVLEPLTDVLDLMAFAAFAIAGADRDKDFEVINDILCRIIPSPGFVLCNDTLAALWCGSNDGTGVAVVAGTGSNCIGINDAGTVAKIGGLGPLSGDVGYGEDLVLKAIIASMKAADGRGKKTILSEKLCQALRIERIQDIIEFWFADSYAPPKLGALAPLVFEAAGEGDEVAQQIIKEAGSKLGTNATVALNRLGWTKSDSPTVVFGGSLFQKATPPLLRESARARIIEEFPNAEIVVPNLEPVVGAVALAIAEITGNPPDNCMKENIGKQINEQLNLQGRD